MRGRPPIDQKPILELWENGLTTSEIAENAGCGMDTVRSILKKNHLKPHPPAFDYSKMWALFDAGWDLGEIAVEFSITPQEVLARMVQNYKQSKIKHWTDENGNLVLLRRRGPGYRIIRRDFMITQSIEKLSKRYALKADIKLDSPDYFDEDYFTALDEGITALQLQNKLKQAILEFKIQHGPEDMVEAREVMKLLESICMEK